MLLFQIAASGAALTQGTKTLLFMPVAFSDAPIEPISQSGARSLMNQVNQFFAEESYNTLSINTDVTPLLILPQTKDYYQVQGHDALAAAARAAARPAGFDAANYDLEIVMHQSLGPPNFNYLATASIGGKGMDLQTSSLSVVVHELGHNLGLYHANFWTAAGDSVIGPGSNGEYGNVFDLMGADSSTPGMHEFGTGNKHALDWLPLSFVHTVTASGTYRVFAFDVPNLVDGQQYALRIQKDYARWYWAEYRQKFTGNPWTQNGVVLNWSPWNNFVGNSLRGPVMLDTTPGTPSGNNGRDDAPVVIGRTFSDPAAGIHLTPLAKGTASSGNWLDLRVNLGSFPGNLSPVLQIVADQSTVPPNTPVSFSATASDRDGDLLAYDWDFGDLTFGTNSPAATKGWTSSGEFVVRCTVSDMKGGVTSRNLVITVGSPETFQIGGRVTTSDGQPVASVRLHNGLSGSSYRGAYTDSDGYYVVANLAAGSHTLSAVKYGYALAAVGWSNPVTVGPSLTNQDWTATQVPILSIAASDPAAAETGADPGMFTLTRSGSLASSLTVKFNLSGIAVYSSDYSLSPTPSAGSALQLVMPAGLASMNIVLTALSDSATEGPETATLTLFEDPAYVLGSLAEATVTIVDSQSPGTPAVNVSAMDDLATESGMDTGWFQITRSGSVAGDLTVNYTVTGTATNGVDLSPLSGVAVIPSGQTSAIVVFIAVDDAAVEGNESVIVSIQNQSAYNVTAPSSATVTVVDNDPPGVTITMTDDKAVEGGSNTGTFTVARVGSLASNLVVQYGLGGTASNGVDYAALPGTVTIPVGQVSASFTVTPLNDSLVEGTETVIATILSNTSYNITNPGAATVLMTDDDSPGISLAATDSSASEAGPNTGTFTFTRSGGTTEPLTVYFSVAGSALNGADYSPLGNSIVIPAGSASVPLTVTPVDDAIKENSETVVVTLLPSPDDYYSLTTTIPKTATISDNDSAGPVGVGFANAASSGSESEFLVRLNVSLSASSSAPVTVNYAFGVGTAGNPGDFVFAMPQPISFSPGEVTKKVTFFQTIDDALVEPGETVLIILSNPTNAVLDAFATHTHTILDNDSGGTVTITAPDASASETGLNTGTFRISRAGATTNNLTVNFQVTGSASSPSDFLAIGNSVVIPAGQNHVDILITPVDDSTPEPVETVTLTLTSAPGASIGANDRASIVLNADNDNNPGILAVTPAAGLDSAGPGGGPFSPATATYTLSNIADTPLDWVVGANAPWVGLSASGGSLAPGASVEVVVTLNPQAGALLPQTYHAVVAFTNTTNANGNTSRELSLTVLPPPQVPNHITLTNDDVVLRFWGIPGHVYRIERSLDLKAWNPLGLKTAAANGFVDFTDTSPPEWQGFYRIVPE